MYLRKKQEFKFDYDESSDDLFLFSPKSKSKGSVEFGDIVLDFNNKKELVGIELINAIKTVREISGLSQLKVKKFLRDINKSIVEVIYKQNSIFIKFYLVADSKELSSTISIPNIVEKSPAIAYA